MLDAIDALLAVITDDTPLKYGSPLRERFEEADRAVWVAACSAGYEDKLPTLCEHCLGRTHLPGEPFPDGSFVPIGWRSWRRELLDLRALVAIKASPTMPQSAKKRPGRPHKPDRSNDEKVTAALAIHHQYESNGSIGNWEPVKGRDLAEQAGVTDMAVSRFMERHFRNQKGYEQACRKRRIGTELARLQNELPDWHAVLRDDE